MPKITAKGPSYADEIRADEPIVVDEHGDDAAAVADAAPAVDAPKPGPKARAKAGA